MSSLKPLDKRCLEDLFGMSTGYVLDFSNRTFSNFFREYANIDIDAQKYAINGSSKANRFRAFIDLEQDALVGKILAELLEYWRYTHSQPTAEEGKQLAMAQQVVERLTGKQPPRDSGQEFVKRDLGKVSFERIPSVSSLHSILEARMAEAFRCFDADASLAVIFLSGSILEGLLLGVASANAQRFNQAPNSPKEREGKVKQFHEWSLAQLIDVAYELDYLKLDVKKFSHVLRDFRNYIHPYEQMAAKFNPDKHTAEICLQVLKAAVASLSGDRI